VKLWGNLSFNPISALTHATLDVLCTDPGTRAVARNMMLEAQAIAEKLGVKFPIDVDRRIEGGAEVGAHRTSMLQDLDMRAGRWRSTRWSARCRNSAASPRRRPRPSTPSWR
jgi:2-dehydropantoate 2-reductase